MNLRRHMTENGLGECNIECQPLVEAREKCLGCDPVRELTVDVGPLVAATLPPVN